ncbi:MAG: bifunctional diguanylate cyclase/phosphodiesterase, partial [Oscillospiraceae bacterium]
APQEHIILDKIGVTEIDALSGAIEQLNENVLNSVIKTDKIISMVNIDIGSFEYTLDGYFVTISDTLAKMFKLQPDSKNYIDKSEFLKKLASIQEHKTSPNIYQYGSTPPKWVKIEAIETDSGVFGIAVDVTKDELTKRSIMMERDYDILTGIYSRFAFQRELNLLFENITFSHAAFMMSDLDNLKYINDTYGHDIGDAYIKSVASLLSRYFSDKNALYARMSGDEFYVFIYGYESDDEIRTILHDFYSLLNSEYVVLPDKTKFRLKMSSGVSWYNKDSCTPEELLRFADFAMYEVMRRVKGAIREFNKPVYSHDSYLLTGKEELYTILDEQFMDYEFQPIICVDDGSTYGYEALMRPHGKNINSPDRLLHLAKAQGQLWRIEKNTFYRVLELYKTSSNLFGNAKLFINSVPNQTLKDSEYAELERLYGDFLSNVVIEITESEKIDDFPLGRKKQLVSKWNAMLALDDYGSGYANDMLLLSLQPNIIKIDQFLIVDIEQSKDKQALITQIVSFAKDRNILVLA